MPTKTRAALAKMTKDQLISEFRELQDRAESAPVLTPMAKTETATKAKAALASGTALSVDDIVQNGAKFGLEVQRAVGAIVEQAVGKATELGTLNEAIKAAGDDLQRLYDIEVAEASIDLLLGDFEKEREDLQNEIAAARTTWEDEEDAYQKGLDEQRRELSAARTREQAEYEYKTRQTRDRATEEFNYKQSLVERDLAAKKALFDKLCADTKAEHIAFAQGLDDERARLTALEATLHAGVQAKIDDAVKSANASSHFKNTIERKDLEASKALVQQQLNDANAQNSRLIAELSSLRSELNRAHAEVAIVAGKAFEATSGRAALAAVMDHSATTSTPQGKRAA